MAYVYQDITGYKKSVISMDISIDDSAAGYVDSFQGGFLVGIGSGIGTNDRLAYSGIIFSGQDGYIFDQEGDFVGGYATNQNFNITTNIHEDGHVSYFIDDVLIKNNLTTLTHKPKRIEWKKEISVNFLNIENKGQASEKL